MRQDNYLLNKIRQNEKQSKIQFASSVLIGSVLLFVSLFTIAVFG